MRAQVDAGDGYVPRCSCQYRFHHPHVPRRQRGVGVVHHAGAWCRGPGIFLLYIARLLFLAWTFRLPSVKERMEEDDWRAKVKADTALTACMERAIIDRAVSCTTVPLLVWGILYIVHLFV